MNSKRCNSDFYFLMNFKNIYVIVLIIFGLIGCIGSLYMPTESDAVLFNTNLDTLKAGRKLYVKKCSSCHNLYLPTKYNNQEWIGIMEKMQVKAKIDSSQKELINKFLVTASKKDN